MPSQQINELTNKPARNLGMVGDYSMPNVWGEKNFSQMYADKKTQIRADQRETNHQRKSARNKPSA